MCYYVFCRQPSKSLLLLIFLCSFSLFNNSGLSEPAPTVTPQDYCSCSGLKSLNQSRQSCPSSGSSPSPNEAQDITEKVINKQSVLLKGFVSNNASHLKQEDSLQADAPIKSSSYKEREEICCNILNRSDPLHICKNVLGSELWEKILQICVEETQVWLFPVSSLFSCGERYEGMFICSLV